MRRPEPYGQWQPPVRRPARPPWRRWRPRNRLQWVLVIVGGGVTGSVIVAGMVQGAIQAANPAPSPSSVAAPKSSSPSLVAHVTKAQFGAGWPFVHITAGTVRCIPRPGAVIGEFIFIADGDGRTFGLNGTALDAGYKDIPASEWRKNPDIPGAGVSIAPLRDPVAKACGL